MADGTASIPNDVQRIYDSWEFYRKAWWRTHYVIGILGVIASITVANNPVVLQQPPGLINAISWLAAVCIALVTFLDAKKRARAYSAAWRVLHLAISEVKAEPVGAPSKNLFAAVTQGETIIANLDA
jgi:hypothetical protein